MNVSISKVKASDIPECLEVIHQSFKTVAEGFGLTQKNCPKHTSFIPHSFLEAQMRSIDTKVLVISLWIMPKKR